MRTDNSVVLRRLVIAGAVLALVLVAAIAALLWSRQREPQMLNQKEPLRSLAFSPDGSLLAGGDGTAQVELWDTKRRSVVRTLASGGRSNEIDAVAFSLDGTLLAVGRSGSSIAGGQVELWEVGRGVRLRAWPIGSLETLTSMHALAFSPDGRTLAIGATSFDGDENKKSLFLADPQSDAPPRRIATPDGFILSLAFAPDGTLIAGEGSGNVRLWDTATGTIKRTLGKHRSIVTSVAVSRDGRQVASAGGNEIILWDLAKGSMTQQIASDKKVDSIAFSPDGTRLVSGDDTRTIRLWNVATVPATALKAWGGLGWEPIAVAYRPDGRQVAAITGGGADSDYVIRLWNTP